MKCIAFTHPEFIAGEAEQLREILPLVDGLHLRKTGETDRADWEALLEALPEEERYKIWLHDHHLLAKKYGVGGIHLSRMRMEEYGLALTEAALEYRKAGRHISASCAHPEEIDNFDGLPDRVFLSPVFDSISKPDHRNIFDISTLRLHDMRSEWIALGGINLENVSKLHACNFDGYAVLGALWEADDPVAFITSFKTICQATPHTY